MIKRYGSNLGIEKKDYYVLKTDSEPTIIYDSSTNIYKYNENVGGSDVTTDSKTEIIYYGLYEEDFGYWTINILQCK